MDSLRTLTIRNYRCFSDHRIEFNGSSLIVGKNNAGKSTCVDALRLISLITERQQGLHFRAPPDNLRASTRQLGLQPGLDSVSLRRGHLFNHNADPPGVISAQFESGASIELFIGGGMSVHALIYDHRSYLVTTRAELIALALPRISILPQVAPLELDETLLSETYVRANLFTTRSSLHFRNQLHLFGESFVAFKELVERSWPGLQVRDFDVPPITDREGQIALVIRDRDFSDEAAYMGHGVQMWLQTMWFLCRSRSSSVLILDEPDVYMHADLQRRLIRMLAHDERQFIVATHSPEMLAEVEPEAVVVLDRYEPISKPADSSEAVQELLRHVGSVHNLSLARLGIHGKLLLVEGEDLAYLKLFQNVLQPQASLPIDALPNVDIGGWGQWSTAVDIARIFRRTVADRVQVFCLFDRDYHTEETLKARMEEAGAAGITLKFWDAKEIENYAVMPAAIARLVTQGGRGAVTTEDIEGIVVEEADRLRENTLDTYSELIGQRVKKGAKVSNPIARDTVNQRWNTLGGPMVVGGKELFAAVSERIRLTYKTSISIRRTIRAAKPHDVSTEVRDFILAVTRPGYR